MPDAMEACIAQLEARKTKVREDADAQIEKIDAAIAMLRGLDGLLLPGPSETPARKAAPPAGSAKVRYFRCKKCKAEKAWAKRGRMPKVCPECKAEKNG